MILKPRLIHSTKFYEDRGEAMPDQMSREECLLALQAKAAGLDRLPKKSDFMENEVARIKSFFGPWPRALEAAGLMPSRSVERNQKKQENRIKAKRKKIDALKNRSNENGH